MEILELDRRVSAPLRKVAATATVSATVTGGAPVCRRPLTRPGRDPRWTP